MDKNTKTGIVKCGSYSQTLDKPKLNLVRVLSSLLLLFCVSTVWAASDSDIRPLYLLFQIFTGASDPKTGVLKASFSEKILKDIKRDINPPRSHPLRKIGFSVGPLAMDQADDEVGQIIREAFEAALANDMAVAFHIDNHMFWKNARDQHGRKLIDNPKNIEATDWRGTPSARLNMSWLPNVPLAPQMCFNSPEIKAASARFAKEVVGSEVRRGVDRLKRAGKEDLFAGVIVGWETDLVDGYCALKNNGFSATKPPSDFELEREKIVHAHIAWWSMAVLDAGIDKKLIYTHTAHLPRKMVAMLKRKLSPDELRRRINSTAFKAIWVAFNKYSNPGFSGYTAEGLLEDYYDELAKHGNPPWAMAEGANIMLAETGPGSIASIMNWETYLGKMFNHGATLVNIYGAWQGESGNPFRQATESREAIAAYRKFLRGERLIEAK